MMSLRLVPPQSQEFRPSAPCRTVRNNPPGNSNKDIFYTNLPRVNLSLSFDHREQVRGRWSSLPKMYQPQSYQYTRDNICYLVDSNHSYSKNRHHIYSKVSQSPHKQSKPFIYSTNRFLDYIPKFENNRKLLIENSLYLRRIEPLKADILLPTHKQSELNILSIPAPPINFKKPIHDIFQTHNAIPSINPRTNKYLSELNGFSPSIRNMIPIANSSEYSANCFPISFHPIPEIHPQGYKTRCLSRLVMGINKANNYDSLLNNDQIGYFKRKHRVDITSNELSIIGFSTFRELRYKNVFYSSRICISPSKQVNSSQHLEIPYNILNDKCTDAYTFSNVYKPCLFPKVHLEPIISPVLQPSDISSLQECNVCLLEAFTTKLPYDVLVKASPNTKYRSPHSTHNDSTTDVQLMQNNRTQNTLSRSNMLHSTLSDIINSNQPMQSTTILNSDHITIHQPKFPTNNPLTTISTVGPKNTNVSLLSNELLPYTINMPSTSLSSNSYSTKLSSAYLNLTKTGSHSNYARTSLIPSPPNITFNDSLFEPNLRPNQYLEKENLFNKDQCNNKHILNTVSCAKDEKQLLFKEYPEESPISLIQSTERVIYSPYGSQSLSLEQIVDDCKYIAIQQNNNSIQLQYLQAFHSQSDDDIASNLFTIRVNEVSEIDHPTPNNCKDFLIEDNIVNSPMVTDFIKEIVNNILLQLDFNLITNVQCMGYDISNNSRKTLAYDKPSSTISYKRKSMTSYAHYASLLHSSSSMGCVNMLRDQLKVNQIMRRTMENQTNRKMKSRRLGDALTNLFDITHAYTYSYYHSHNNFEDTSSDEDVN
ncbi:hypothetical protein LOD99_6755 [Oopsacas minuta]|uniref:Uncharacterized protein n=1 Tax=Oopsacas minuta TaxID=111878 RepID=A0AAV7JL64_9METZ|nr:hypothetical protein LOD99_6755 [Oopsacas minuta]